MAAAGDRPVVHAPAGTVSGETRGGIRAFKGLPFARPPVGDARWKPPAPSAPWQGVRDARSFGPACVQPRSRPGSIYAEDYPAKIGRASCRERVCQYVEISVVAVSLKKKNNKTNRT